MPRLFLLVALVLIATPANAQVAAQAGATASALHVGSQRPPTRITAGAVYQQYSLGEGRHLAQWSTPVSALVPVAAGTAFALRATYADATGSDMTPVRGPADVQLALSTLRPVRAGSVVGSLTVNLPSGVRALTADEAETAFLVGQGFYAFALPTYGQGLGVTPALTVAVPVGERLAVGGGVAYQVRGAFRPRADREDRYNPSDEAMLTAGLDARVGEATTLALDVTALLYSTDTWGDASYTPGNAAAVTARLATGLGPHEAQLVARLGIKGATDVPPTVALGQDATVPTQVRLLGHARLRAGAGLRVGVLAQARHYAASDVFSSRTLVDVGLAPELRLGGGLSLVGRAGATLGTHTGFEAGMGVAWTR